MAEKDCSDMSRPRKQLDLLNTFRAPRILTLEELCRRLHCSRSTVLRRLHEQDYHSSYNQAGKFLTLAQVADFDARGLWVWKTARFSKHGTLKDTVDFFVNQSSQGMTHEELASLLAVRAHNPLLELVKEKRIRRERLGPRFVYVSAKASRRREQVHRRKSLLLEPQRPRPSSPQIMAVLLELIQQISGVSTFNNMEECKENILLGGNSDLFLLECSLLARHTSPTSKMQILVGETCTRFRR